MFVLNGNALNLRSTLSRPEGFLLDYSLFLIAEDTPRIYQSRPIGLRTLKAIALNHSAMEHNSMVRCIADELRTYNVLGDLPIGLPKTDPERKEGKNRFFIADEWLRWIESSSSSSLTEAIANQIETELDSDLNFSKLAMLCRRFSSELLDEFRSRRTIFQQVQSLIRDEDAIPFFRENFCRIGEIAKLEKYTVEFQLAPASVRGGLKNQVESRFQEIILTNWRDIILPNHRYDDDEFAVTGCAYEVSARNVNEASALAIPMMQETQIRLRSELTVTTSTIRGILVTDSEGNRQALPRANPFWRKSKNLPKHPEFPLRCPEGVSRSRFNAARYHYANAIGNWADDVHAAASSVWQGIDAWSDHLGDRGIPDYRFSEVTLPMRQKSQLYFAGKCDLYYHNLRKITKASSRVFKASKPSGHELWFRKTFSKDAKENFRSFRPYAPDILFQGEVGLLRNESRFPPELRDRHWMNKRLSQDLRFLYAVRNMLVHSGDTSTPPAFVEYLAGLGVETLLSMVNNSTVIRKGGT